MKFFFWLCALTLSVFCFWETTPVMAEEDVFAQITDENVFLMKTSNENFTFENVMFSLPSSYFVKILGEQEEFFYVEFDDNFGFVKKSQVTRVYGTPENPFPKNISFEINKNVAATLKNLPTIDADTLGLALPQEKLKFFGFTEGEELLENLGTNWIFASLETPTENIKGYVYAPFVTNLVEIPQNTESLPTTPPQTENTKILSEDLTNPNNLWLIGVLLFVVFLLFLVTFLPFHIKGKRRNISLN